MDLTKIKKPFGLLSEKKQKALKEHSQNGGVVQFYHSSGRWEDKWYPGWFDQITYRAKPDDPRPLTVKDWALMPPWANYVVRDGDDGSVWAYQHSPAKGDNCWWIDAESDGKVDRITEDLPFIDPGT